MQLVAYQCGELMNYLRVVDVFALSGHRHKQVLADQPDDQLGVPRAESMSNTEIFGIFHA